MKQRMLMGLVAAVIAAMPFASVSAGDSHAGLNVGDKVPSFMAINQEGELWKAGDLLGKKNLVVYFYPAAMTGGCTKQACGFRDNLGKLQNEDTAVIGVSGDVPAGLRIFEKAHDLNFTLLSDYDGRIAELFGVPTRDGGSIKRDFQGEQVTLNRGVTASRWTYIINKDGKVVFKNKNVNAAKDSQAVLDFLESES